AGDQRRVQLTLPNSTRKAPQAAASGYAGWQLDGRSVQGRSPTVSTRPKPYPAHKQAVPSSQARGAQSTQICMAAPRPRITGEAAQSGGYTRAGANRHWLPIVSRFVAPFRADRRLFAAARFIGRVDSCTQIIVFGAAGTAMSAPQPQHHRPSGHWREVDER